MSKIKKFIAIFIFFFATFIFSSKVSAAELLAIKPDSANLPTLAYHTNGIDYTRYLNRVAVFSVIDGTNVYHSYCVEPGQSLSYSGSSSTKSLSNYLGSTKATLISYALSYAYKIPDYTGGLSAAQTKSLTISATNYKKILAAQALVWEIAMGERTSLSTYKPNGQLPSDSLYKLIYDNRNGTTNVIWNEYVRIIDAVRFTYLSAPENTSINSTESKKSMAWDSTKGLYTITLHDKNNAYKYFKVSSTEQGVKASISSDGSTLVITSAEPIESTTAARVTLTSKSANAGGRSTVYIDSASQDITTISGASISYYVNVNTPEFQLKIIKQDSLNKTAIAGAKFYVCTNSSCTKKLATLTTNASGEATYTKIPTPGTYYLKEIFVPAGYMLSSTPVAIKVTNSNVVGTSSYATKVIYNSNKTFNLTKMTVDESGKTVLLDDGCGAVVYTGPEFEMKNSTGETIEFKEIAPGKYEYSEEKKVGTISKLKTCNGKFIVYTLPECNYTISETKAPQGLTLPSSPTKAINVCGADKNVSYTNGYVGLEFQKKDEDGKFLTGGKFALQMKVNNVYKDVILKETEEPGFYTYEAELKDTDDGATYILLTETGIVRISKLPPGEYRIVEKEAPEGYEPIKDKDSTAIVTIKDTAKSDYYLVELINQKINVNGSRSSAELIVTIITGRTVINYALVIGGLVLLLIAVIIIRKKTKK